MTTLSNTPKKQDALNDIRIRKAEIKHRMQETSVLMKQETTRLFAPRPQATTKIGSFMNLVDQGMAIYDGIMMGMRIARSFRRLFRK